MAAVWSYQGEVGVEAAGQGVALGRWQLQLQPAQWSRQRANASQAQAGVGVLLLRLRQEYHCLMMQQALVVVAVPPGKLAVQQTALAELQNQAVAMGVAAAGVQVQCSLQETVLLMYSVLQAVVGHGAAVGLQTTPQRTATTTIHRITAQWARPAQEQHPET